MGTHGPIPKRSEERRRRNTDEEGPALTQAPSGAPVGLDLELVPPVNKRWHPIARRWYEALPLSGQAVFYEPSDWAMAQYAAELMSRLLRDKTPSGQVKTPNGQAIAALDSVMARLLTTEGDRRRARIELERRKAPAETPSGVTVLDDYRSAFGG